MSTIKVQNIQHTGSSTNAIALASDGSCTANITNRTNKNLILNGAFQIAQRGVSSTTSGYGSVDRFKCEYSGTDEATTQAQVDVASGTTPYTLGFRKAYKVTNGNQTSGAGSSDRITILHLIEAQDMANSGWNYLSSSSYITFSYWVKSSVAQNFYVRFKSADTTSQAYVIETGSLSADTWTKITKTISGNSNIVFNNDNGEGLEITWELFRGTDQTGTRPLNAWAASDNATRTPDQTSTWYTTNDATFEITGVQLEVGSVATDFEHRSFAQELTLCERYCQTVVAGIEAIGIGMAYSTGSVNCIVDLTTEMRTTPTISQTSGTDYYSIEANGGRDNLSDFSSGFHSRTWKRRLVLHAQTGVSQVAGHASQCEGYNANALILALAEL